MLCFATLKSCDVVDDKIQNHEALVVLVVSTELNLKGAPSLLRWFFFEFLHRGHSFLCPTPLHFFLMLH